MAATITNSVPNTNSTVISVDWSIDATAYPSVRVDMYLTSVLAKQKPGAPFPPPADNKGGINSPSTPPIDAVNGFPLPFTGLTPGTSYTFVLYGWSEDPDTGGAPLPIWQATSDPISTLGAAGTPQPKKPQPAVDYPDLAPQPHPKDLNNTNRVIVVLNNPNLFVQWYITLDGTQDPNSMGPNDFYQFETSPGESFSISASGKLISTGLYSVSPTMTKIAGKNSYSVQGFLGDSGVDGTNGIRQFLVSSKSTSVRDMLGI